MAKKEIRQSCLVGGTLGFRRGLVIFFRGIQRRFSPKRIENTFLDYPASTFRPLQLQYTPVSGPLNKSTTIFHGLYSFRP